MFTNPYAKQRDQAMSDAINNLDLNFVKALFNTGYSSSQKKINEFLIRAIYRDIDQLYDCLPNEKNKLLELIKLLVANGASIFCCNENDPEFGETVADVIGRNGSNKLVEFLAKRINLEKISLRASLYQQAKLKLHTTQLGRMSINLLLGAFECLENGNAKLILNNIISMKDMLMMWRDSEGNGLFHFLISQDPDCDACSEKEKWEIAGILLNKYGFRLFWSNKQRESPLDVAKNMGNYSLLNAFNTCIKIILKNLHRSSSEASSKKNDKQLAEIIYLIDIYNNLIIGSQSYNQQQNISKNISFNKKTTIDVGGKNYICSVKDIEYKPGWCAFDAVQDVIKNPTAALKELINFIAISRDIEKKKIITKKIASALYNNIVRYYTSPLNQRRNELFPIDNSQIKAKITTMYNNIDATVSGSNNHTCACNNLWQYINNVQVQIAYLNTIIKQKYPDNLIVAACLAMYGKTLYTFRSYSDNNGNEIFFCDFDTANANVKDPNAISVVHYPNQNVLLSHYCRLIIVKEQIVGIKRERPQPNDDITQQNKKRKL